MANRCAICGLDRDDPRHQSMPHMYEPEPPVTTRDAIIRFFEILKRECYPEQSWEYAMNEMDERTNAAFNRALQVLQDALNDEVGDL